MVTERSTRGGRRNRVFLLAVASLCAALWTYACGDGAAEPTSPPPDPPRATTVAVSPAADTLVAGDTLRLAAEALDANGNTIAGAAFTWSSSDASVATVDASGLVRGIAEGTATITAAAGEARATAEITIANPDRAALVALYEATDGPNWFDSRNWLTDTPLRNWSGVSTNEYDRVTGLRLFRNNLSGTIPPELDGLVELEDLSLDYNALTGPIPPTLGDLVNMEDLTLGGNRLTGEIPPELGGLANLRELRLSENGLTGPIPSELGNLANLEVLSVWQNQLSGPLPNSFLGLASLTGLDIGRNDGLCLPATADFVGWAESIRIVRGPYCNQTDRLVLEALHGASGGRNWINSTGWATSAPLGDWHGVTTDSIGNVVTLDLAGNGLAGRLVQSLGDLARLTSLRIGGNDLTERLPLSLARLSLRELHYSGTGLCVPADESFQQWLAGIPSHEGTGEECGPPSDRDVLVEVYDALGGPGWSNSRNWVTDAPVGTWHGVQVDGEGRVVELGLYQNRLAGAIPASLGRLSRLKYLRLQGNDGLTGPIPPELGDLSELQTLILKWNHLRTTIPPELGRLSNLRILDLELARLRGSIPAEIGRLANLRRLNLSRNAVDGGQLAGTIPESLGDLTNLQSLYLSENNHTGPLPDEIGRLTKLLSLDISRNDLTGPIPALNRLTNLLYLALSDNSLSGTLPAELGGLARLEVLAAERLELTGSVPAGLGGLARLRELRLTNNAGMTGPLPGTLTGLGNLDALLAGGTSLCAPSDSSFAAWLRGVPRRRIAACTAEAHAAYLTQAAQSREFPVPLVADEQALLRVFPTAQVPTNENIPAVRAKFYLNDAEVHSVTIPGKAAEIPTEVYEGDLRQSANVAIPGQVVQPGLKIVIDIDPDSTLDRALGVTRRIPETGRLAVEVQRVPLFDLTVIPFLVTSDPDSSIVRIASDMAADPEGHEALWGVRTLMPVEGIDVTAHAPVWTSTDDSRGLLAQTEMIRVAEGGNGYYMGMLPYFVGGSAYVGGRSSFTHANAPGLTAHEIGHNFNLLHAPCPGVSISRVDPSFPHARGLIGVWGYDFRDGRLVRPSTGDVMGYCGYEWPSDYHFTNALRFRTSERARQTAASAGPIRSLLLWGGVDGEGEPFLEPAFVIDAPPALPDSAGTHEVVGRAANGRELFNLSFTMPEVADAEGAGSFVYALPVRAGWEGLAMITLTGPGGSVTLDGESDLPMAILRNAQTGQIRGILREPPPATQAAADAVGQGVGTGLDVLFSRGIPDAASWRR